MFSGLIEMKLISCHELSGIVLVLLSTRSHVSIDFLDFVLIPFDCNDAIFFRSDSFLTENSLMKVVFDVQMT